MTKTLRLCTALLLAIAAASTQAANYAGTTFEIEMIVFSHTQGMDKARETWPAAPRLQYPNRWVDFNSTNGASPILRPATTRLGNKAAALSRSGNYRVLFHKAWRQVLQNKRNSPAIVITGGDTSGGHHQLEGSVTVSVARYLHLSTDLWYNDFGTAQGDSGVLLPPLPAADEPMDLAGGGFGTASFGGPSTGPVYAQHVAVLQEERRMRSGELHYIDHPQLGVLIEVRTVRPSEG